MNDAAKYARAGVFLANEMFHEHGVPIPEVDLSDTNGVFKLTHIPDEEELLDKSGFGIVALGDQDAIIMSRETGVLSSAEIVDFFAGLAVEGYFSTDPTERAQQVEDVKLGFNLQCRTIEKSLAKGVPND